MRVSTTFVDFVCVFMKLSSGLPFLFLLLLIKTSFSSIPTVCYVWKNSWVSFSLFPNSTSSPNFTEVTLESRIFNQYIGFSLSPTPYITKNTLLFIANANTLYTLTNHPNVIILNSTPNIYNTYDPNILVANFMIPKELYLNFTYVVFAENSRSGNITFEHTDFGMTDDADGFCQQSLGNPARIVAYSSISYYLVSWILYPLLIILAVYYRDVQPFKSRSLSLI